MDRASWADVIADAPALAAFVADRLGRAPAYLATVRADGMPRVHPVTPVVGEAAMWVFMEPTSPKGMDLRDRGGFALHAAVPDNDGTGGEALVTGTGVPVGDPEVRALAVAAASYDPADRYVLFELHPTEVRATAYDDVNLLVRRWPVPG